jgi:hypothetical protein
LAERLECKPIKKVNEVLNYLLIYGQAIGWRVKGLLSIKIRKTINTHSGFRIPF